MRYLGIILACIRASAHACIQAKIVPRWRGHQTVSLMWQSARAARSEKRACMAEINGAYMSFGAWRPNKYHCRHVRARACIYAREQCIFYRSFKSMHPK